MNEHVVFVLIQFLLLTAFWTFRFYRISFSSDLSKKSTYTKKYIREPNAIGKNKKKQYEFLAVEMPVVITMMSFLYLKSNARIYDVICIFSICKCEQNLIFVSFQQLVCTHFRLYHEKEIRSVCQTVNLQAVECVR